MDLRITPFAKISTALSAAQSTFHETPLFNTHRHQHTEIATLKHVRPDESVQDLGNWIELIMSKRGGARDEAKYQTIQLMTLLMQGILDASTVYSVRGAPNRNAVAELLELFPRRTRSGIPKCEIFEGNGEDVSAERSYFIRPDACSTKDSFRRGAPVHTLEDLVVDLCTSLRAAGALESMLSASGHESSTANLYLLPFNAHMSTEREFRVFCPPSADRVAAISQYKWHAPFFTAECDRTREVCEVVYEGALGINRDVMAYVQEEGREFVRGKVHSEGFVMDLLFVGREAESEEEQQKDNVQLMEINPFGAMSGCGSALFHWIDDARALYGVNEGVQFRITMDE